MACYVENETGTSFPFSIEETVQGVMETVLENEACPYEAVVNVLLTDDAGIREWNRKYRSSYALTILCTSGCLTTSLLVSLQKAMSSILPNIFTATTYLAMAMADFPVPVNDVHTEASEKLGFLPGDLQSKVDPYLRPLYDALYQITQTPSLAPGLSGMHHRSQPLLNQTQFW